MTKKRIAELYRFLSVASMKRMNDDEKIAFIRLLRQMKPVFTEMNEAVNDAIEKAKGFGFDLQGSVMASDAFFPFPDCVEIAHEAGVTAVIQPGGSVRDAESVEYCNNNDVAMVITGFRHFKH